MIYIANILLTRRCNLRCSYCNIVKEYNNMPKEYTSIYEYSKNELVGEEWIDIICRLYKNNKNCFFIFYGGEPTLYKDLHKIISYCNKNNINYTIISNNTSVANKKIYELYDKVGMIKGFTSSVDPIIFDDSKTGDIIKKSKCGLENLSKLKKDNIVDDVVAEITVTKQSIQYLISMVEELTKRNIYSSITAIDDQKTKYYDFSNIKSYELISKNNNLKNIFDELIDRSNKKELLIHIPQLLNVLYNHIESDYKCDICDDLHNVTIEPNGHFRLCLRIKGISTNLFYKYVISNDGIINSDFMKHLSNDYNIYCKGCNWTCPMMSSFKFRNSIIEH